VVCANDVFALLIDSVTDVVLDGGSLDNLEGLRSGTAFVVELCNEVVVGLSGSFVGSVFLIEILIVACKVGSALFDVLVGV
jgi:hypothetical protein